MVNTLVNSAFNIQIKAAISTGLSGQSLSAKDGTVYALCAKSYPVTGYSNGATVVSYNI